MSEQEIRKTALVVGAKRVGRVVCRRLARDSINLAIAYRSSVNDAQQLEDEIRCDADLPDIETTLIQADLCDESAVENAIHQTVSRLGSLDYVVNLASDYPHAPFDTLDASAWERAMGSAKGAYLLGVHAVRHMGRSNNGPVRGHIVFFGDWAAEETPYRDYLPYLTAKSAIHFMTRCLAAEAAPLGVRVNTVAPGPTMRPPEIPQDIWDRDINAKAPLQQESSSEDIANIIAVLLQSSSITGEIIRVDSGRHIRGI